MVSEAIMYATDVKLKKPYLSVKGLLNQIPQLYLCTFKNYHVTKDYIYVIMTSYNHMRNILFSTPVF